MNKDNAKEYLKLIQAYIDGKTIEFNNGVGWVVPAGITLSYEPDQYRIKPDPIEVKLWVNDETGEVCGGLANTLEVGEKDIGYTVKLFREVI